jgi:HAD superfamily hydrolase (TIGR01549 family)
MEQPPSYFSQDILAPPMTILEGDIATGLGRGADFTQLEWVRRQLVELVGIDPTPGTLNLALVDDENLARWRQWRSVPGYPLQPADPSFCSARCYAVQVAGRIPAAVLLPDVDGYPEDKVEVVAALPIRSYLSPTEAARLRIELCRPLPVKAVLFDLDGTLIDSVGAYIELARVAAEPYGFEVTREHVRNALSTGDNFWRGLIPADRVDREALVKELSAHALREWPRVLREYATLFAGLSQTLGALTMMGIRLGIVSGARPEVLELLRAERLLDRFDAIVLGPDVSRMKPDPEGLLKCLDKLQVSPADAIYVGDAPIDIQASRAAGLRIVSVLTGAADSALLSTYCPDRLISSHARLAGIVTCCR